jgi:hypothetical protein
MFLNDAGIGSSLCAGAKHPFDYIGSTPSSGPVLLVVLGYEQSDAPVAVQQSGDQL